VGGAVEAEASPSSAAATTGLHGATWEALMASPAVGWAEAVGEAVGNPWTLMGAGGGADGAAGEAGGRAAARGTRGGRPDSSRRATGNVPCE
jgi:hypothetical protein